jgi:hypothetical protein
MKKFVPLLIFALALIPLWRSEAPALEKASVSDALKKQGTMTIWGFVPEEKLETVFQQFAKQYPETELRYQQFSDLEEYDKVLKKNLGKSRNPDLFFFSGEKKNEYPDVESAPFEVDTLKLFYNQRYFPAGIERQWIDFAEKLRNIKIAGIAMGRLDNMRYGGDLLKALILQKGIDRKDEATAFFKRFADPKDRYFNWTDALNKNYPDQEIDSFVKEKIASVAAYSADIPFIQKKMQEVEKSKRPHLRPSDLQEAALPQFDPSNPKYLARMIMVGMAKTSLNDEKVRALFQLLAEQSEEAKASQQLTIDM